LISFVLGFASINYMVNYATDTAIQLDKPLNWYSPFAAVGITLIGMIVGFLGGSILYRHMVNIVISLRKISGEDKRSAIFGQVFSCLFALGAGLISFVLGYASIDTMVSFATNPTLPPAKALKPIPHVLHAMPHVLHAVTTPALPPVHALNWYSLLAAVGITLIGMIGGYLVGSLLYRRLVDIGGSLRKIPSEDKLMGVLGTFFGLIPTFILGYLVWNIKLPSAIASTSASKDTIHFALVLLVAVPIIWLSNVIASSMKEEMRYFLPNARNPLLSDSLDTFNQLRKQRALLLDTSAIIDGRIFDICRAGFLEGLIILPAFVLAELQHIADSSNALRRNRGRRGLDILYRMQKELDTTIHILDRYKTTFAPGDDVDTKLVKLAESLGNADLLTTDYTLNKVARLRGVRILNVNELANALKPVILPGEELTINIVREGKEYNQGIGYLDDGTMVVVEHGKPSIGQTVPVAVSSVLQTVAGKMIFAERVAGDEAEEEVARRTSR
jgi:uncharacterized protein YacL